MQVILKTYDLVKKYDDFTAVKGINFQVYEGEIFGFLGPNGAGKTTTINMLTGISRITSGTAELAGYDLARQVKKAQEYMGIVPDESNLYDELDGFDNLCFCASLYGIPKDEREERAKMLLHQFGLADAGKKLFKAYSKGMKRKLTIAAGIIHRPKVLFLDEPTSGIDVGSARQIRELILRLNKEGTTIFLTTHYIEEAERLCHRIAFIVNGSIVRIGTLKELMKEVQKDTVVQFTLAESSDFQAETPENHLEAERDQITETPKAGKRGGTGKIRKLLKEGFPDYGVEVLDGNLVKIHSKDSINLLPFIIFFNENKLIVTEAKLIKPSLEEVFIKVTGLGLADMKKEKERGKK